MKVTMLGAGYVGLVSGACISSMGNDVICADIDPEKIQMLNDAKSPIFEPGLDDLLHENIEHGRLKFTTDVHAAILESEVIFITVGTPQATDGSADLSAVMSTARTIGEVLQKTSEDKVVVVKSTVPVGTTRAVDKIIASYLGHHSCVASNPEFLREGTAVEDFFRPDRIVIGTSCHIAEDTLRRLYRPLSSSKIFVMDSASSELVKYSANAYLATRISFMNELSHLAAALGADIDHVRIGLGSDSRIGPQYLYPGPGYGGSCLPKDVSAFVHMADTVGQEMMVVNAAQEANKQQRQLLGSLVKKYFENLSGKKICIWGAAYKAETDDIRESPAIVVIEDMLAGGAHVTVHDPQALGRVHERFKSRVVVNDDQYEAAKNADAIVLCTEWRQYRAPNTKLLVQNAPKLVAFDGRNVWDKRDFDAAGIRMFSLICKPQISETTTHSRENYFNPISVLPATNGVVPSRRPPSLQNNAVDETGSRLRIIAKG
jgi:UDPglucose 6-dehydrogenase